MGVGNQSVGIDTTIWKDPSFKMLSQDSKMLWFYILTMCPTGICRFSFDFAASDLGWRRARLTQAWDELYAEGENEDMEWDGTWCVLLLHDKYSPRPSNPNVMKNWMTNNETLPKDSDLVAMWYDSMDGIEWDYSGSRERRAVLERDNHTCQYCGKGPLPPKMLHVDHVVARDRGGSEGISNKVTACIKCNIGKSNLLLFEEWQPPSPTDAIMNRGGGHRG